MSRHKPTHEEVIMALRRFAAVHANLTRDFANSFGLHPTDAAALTEIVQSQDSGLPLTPSELAARLARSRSATSAVINRLAADGHIARRVSSRDGRSIELVCDTKTYQQAQRYFVPLGRAMATVLGARTADELRASLAMLDECSEAVAGVLQEKAAEEK